MPATRSVSFPASASADRLASAAPSAWMVIGSTRIVVGGHSPAAFRRAVARGHGWFGNGSPDDLVRCLKGLDRTAAEVERPARLGRLEITFLQLNPVTVDASAARRYAELGVDRLVVYPLPLEDPEHVLRFLEQHAGLIA